MFSVPTLLGKYIGAGVEGLTARQKLQSARGSSEGQSPNETPGVPNENSGSEES